MSDLTPVIRLNNGVEIPRIGYGTFTIDNESVTALVESALKVGYRHIDTASFYQNEKGVGKAIKNSGIPRGEIFITSKVWMDSLGYEKTIASFEQTLADLEVSYLDLFLLHWPRPLGPESWKALETLYKEGRVRAIGVSNYNIRLLKELMEGLDTAPAVNQIELHPRLQRKDLLTFCTDNDITVEAWAPIMKGKVVNIPLLNEIGGKYGKTAVQVTLRWHLQNGIIVLPKASSESRMIENLTISDFKLSDGEMELIDSLDRGERVGLEPEDVYVRGLDALKNR